MKRDYGLCLWTFGNVPFEEKCRLASEVGVNGVEVEGDISQNPREIVTILSKYDLKILSITPNNVDISSDNESVRKRAVEYFLDLLSWADELGAKRICLHGDVGKVVGSGDEQKDWTRLVESSKEILQKAENLHIEVVFEVLNRYENHQVRTGQEALKLIKDVKSSNLKVLLDSYHMNIEEENPAQALKDVGQHLGVYHIGDSNRQGIGQGHANIYEQIEVLHKIDYRGPIIMEMTAPGPNPFTPVKEEGYIEVVKNYYKDSLSIVKEWEQNKIQV